MGTVSQSTWRDLLGHLRVRHPHLVRGWFRDLDPIDLKNGIVSVRAANDAQVRYLQRHGTPPFAEAAQAVMGRLVSVAFLTDQRNNGKTRSPGLYRDPADSVPLNPDFTFEHYVTGPSNHLAHAAAVAVGTEPGRGYNPLLVHGPVGLGKTHLLQAICRSIRTRDADTRCLFLPCETFVNHFVEAIEQGTLNRFHDRYRHVDVLLIDDIQLLAQRERSQEEFFHTFNALYQSRRQIILSADRAPRDIVGLEDRLASRFNSGLVAPIDRPTYETRLAIVQKKARLRCIEISGEVAGMIATRINTNIRDLDDALTRIDALGQSPFREITPELAARAIGHAPDREVRIPAVLEAVSRKFNVTISEIQGPNRSRRVTHPRHIGMFLARRLTTQSLETIGGHFGGRNHTTVLHAVRVVDQRIMHDPELRALLDETAAEVENDR